MELLSNEFVSTIIYAVLALVLMFVGYKIFDIITPYKFSDEIKEKNTAVGVVIAAIFIAVGIIIKAAITS